MLQIRITLSFLLVSLLILSGCVSNQPKKIDPKHEFSLIMPTSTSGLNKNSTAKEVMDYLNLYEYKKQWKEYNRVVNKYAYYQKQLKWQINESSLMLIHLFCDYDKISPVSSERRCNPFGTNSTQITANINVSNKDNLILLTVKPTAEKNSTDLFGDFLDEKKLFKISAANMKEFFGFPVFPWTLEFNSKYSPESILANFSRHSTKLDSYDTQSGLQSTKQFKEKIQIKVGDKEIPVLLDISPYKNGTKARIRGFIRGNINGQMIDFIEPVKLFETRMKSIIDS